MKGIKILVTCPENLGAYSLTHRLKEQGGEILSYPLIEILPPKTWDTFDQILSVIEQVDWIIFTSRNGCDFCLRRMKELGKSYDILNEAKIACVGTSTAQVLQMKGLTVELIPEQHQSEGLLKELVKYPIEGKRFWLIQAEEPRETLRQGLERLKGEVFYSPVYRNQLPDMEFTPMLELLKSCRIDWLIFTSASAVANLFQLIPVGWGKEWTDNLKVGCLGEITAEALKDYDLKVDVQPNIQDYNHLVESLCEHVVLN